MLLHFSRVNCRAVHYEPLGRSEGGYPFDFGNGWQLEPQVQIVWQNVDFDEERSNHGD